ncbi:asparaginase [Hamadaea tsunoensis]|uniref:asparaginase n=1 Tax=Hamadaea tsunoensis TaxID=53368 RepID=UPI00047F47DB|nr:asparaginase [Hamadaea tsunoensis]
MVKAYEGGVALAEVVRSRFVEGFHRGSVVVLGPDGSVVAAAGDVTGPIFPRSSNKPMQAVGMLRAGLRLADPADLALAAASHFGQDFHISRVRALLRSAGLEETVLRCPPDLPLDEDARAAVLRAGGTRERVYMNCSGKHAGMLLTCLAAGWELEGYLDQDHPLQVRLRDALETCAGEPVAATGIDGCGAPVMAISLTGLARSFLGLVDAPEGSAERSVADAMRAYPEIVSGTNQHDDRLMKGVTGLLSKGGAEGVHALAVPGVGAVALKIDDGGMRARMPVVASALRRLGVVAPVLDELTEEPLLGGGVRVGAVHAIW